MDITLRATKTSVPYTPPVRTGHTGKKALHTMLFFCTGRTYGPYVRVLVVRTGTRAKKHARTYKKCCQFFGLPCIVVQKI